MEKIQPYYQNTNITLYNNDVKDVVRLIDNNSIDLMLTDPPYGINYVSNHRKDKMKEIQNDDVLFMDIDMFWDKIKDTGSLWSFYSHKIELNDNKNIEDGLYRDNYHILSAAIRLMRNDLKDGNVRKSYIIEHINTALSIVEENIEKNKLSKPHLTRIKNRIIWVKNNWSAGDLEGDFGNQYECIAFMPKNKFKLRGYRYSNIWEFSRIPPSNHPTEKPPELLRRIITSCTDVGDLVYDPYVGSGATLFECKKLKRRFIGSEISKEYCEDIVNDDRMKQMGLGI